MKFDLSFAVNDPKLNGSHGQFRGERNDDGKGIISADNDFEAIDAFLLEYTERPATFRNYTKEAERLHLWTLLYLGKPLSSMARDDFARYIDFMKKPDPEWCGPKVSRKSADWRPFTGALSPPAIKTAVASLNSMFNWLVNAGYLTGNPLGLIRKRNQADSAKKVERFLDEDMFDALLHVIETSPIKTETARYKNERMRFMLTAFILLGARISELANAKMGDFHKEVGGWFWDVIGKGGKRAKVAMPPDMLNALMRWRVSLGLSPTPKSGDQLPAIPFISKDEENDFEQRHISTRRINQILKRFFFEAADQLESGGQLDAADKLRQASAHWLRHTSITQKVNAGIDRAIVQKEARHADARTTNAYTHDEERERSRQATKHKLNWS